MRWAEIDRSAKTWLIAAERMKGKRAHVVPLSDLALQLLDEASAATEGNGSGLYSRRRASRRTPTSTDERSRAR